MKNNEGKFYIIVTAESCGTTGQLFADNYNTSDLCFNGDDTEFDTFDEAVKVAEAIDLQDFAEVVIDNMKWESVGEPAGGSVCVEVMEGDGGLVDYEYSEHTGAEGGIIEIKSINIGCKTAQAELTKASSTSKDLSADCPECGLADAYVSTGEHAESGGEFVRCSGCGNWFYITW